MPRPPGKLRGTGVPDVPMGPAFRGFGEAVPGISQTNISPLEPGLKVTAPYRALKFTGRGQTIIMPYVAAPGVAGQYALAFGPRLPFWGFVRSFGFCVAYTANLIAVTPICSAQAQPGFYTVPNFPAVQAMWQGVSFIAGVLPGFGPLAVGTPFYFPLNYLLPQNDWRVGLALYQFGNGTAGAIGFIEVVEVVPVG